MSRSSSRLRRLGLTGLASLAALSAASSAHAASTTLSAQCTFPAVGAQSVKLGLDIADTAKVGEPKSLVSVTSVTIADGAPIIDGLSEADGTLKTQLQQASGVLPLPSPVTFGYPLDAPAAADPVTPTVAGQASLIPTGLSLHLTLRDADGEIVTPPPVVPGGDDDANPDTLDIPCGLLPVVGMPPTVLITDGGSFGPTIPGPLTFSEVTETSILLKWGASVDDQGIAGYVVSVDGRPDVQVSGNQTSLRLTGLTRDTTYSVSVGAIDTDGNRSQEATGSFTTPGHVDDFLLPPTDLKVTDQTPTSFTITWSHSGRLATSFAVYLNGNPTPAKVVTAKTATITGLILNTQYSVAVEAIDAEGNRSQRSPSLQVTTAVHPELDFHDYTLSGSATLKTLVRGQVPLKGNLGVAFGEGGQAGTPLKLDPTTARLTALGFLPVTAKLAFVTSGRTTATPVGGNGFTAATKVRIKVTEAKLFGAIPLTGGNNCQTRELVDLSLATEPAFSLLSGGKLSGTFAMSNLNGCGSLNGLVSPATAGKGNTITLYALGLIPPPITL